MDSTAGSDFVQEGSGWKEPLILVSAVSGIWRFCIASRFLLPFSMETKQDPRDPAPLMAFMIRQHDKLCLSTIIFLICVCSHPKKMCRSPSKNIVYNIYICIVFAYSSPEAVGLRRMVCFMHVLHRGDASEGVALHTSDRISPKSTAHRKPSIVQRSGGFTSGSAAQHSTAQQGVSTGGRTEGSDEVVASASGGPTQITSSSEPDSSAGGKRQEKSRTGGAVAHLVVEGDAQQKQKAPPPSGTVDVNSLFPCAWSVSFATLRADTILSAFLCESFTLLHHAKLLIRIILLDVGHPARMPSSRPSGWKNMQRAARQAHPHPRPQVLVWRCNCTKGGQIDRQSYAGKEKPLPTQVKGKGSNWNVWRACIVRCKSLMRYHKHAAKHLFKSDVPCPALFRTP